MTREKYIDEIIVTLKQDYDESSLDRRLIGRWLDTQRSLFIKNRVNRGESIEDNIMQTIAKIPVEVASDSMNAALKSSGRLLVTSTRLPRFIEFKDSLGVVSVRIPKLLGYEVSMVNREDLAYTGNGFFNIKKQ